MKLHRKMLGGSIALFYCTHKYLEMFDDESWISEELAHLSARSECSTLCTPYNPHANIYSFLELFEQQTVFYFNFSVFHFSSPFTLQPLSWLYYFDAISKWWCACICCLFFSFIFWCLCSVEISSHSISKCDSFRWEMHFCCDIESHTWCEWWRVCHAVKAYCSEHVHIFKKKREREGKKKRETAKFTIRRRFVMGICWLYARFCLCVCVCWFFAIFHFCMPDKHFSVSTLR